MSGYKTRHGISSGNTQADRLHQQVDAGRVIAGIAVGELVEREGRCGRVVRVDLKSPRVVDRRDDAGRSRIVEVVVDEARFVDCSFDVTQPQRVADLVRQQSPKCIERVVRAGVVVQHDVGTGDRFGTRVVSGSRRERDGFVDCVWARERPVGDFLQHQPREDRSPLRADRWRRRCQFR